MTTRVLLVVSLMAVGPAWTEAQSLAEIARAEEARRKAQTGAGKVYTNDDLRPDFTRPAPSPEPGADAAAAAPDAAPAAGADATPASPAAPGAAPAGGTRDQAYWANRMAEARSQLERSRTFAAALQSRIDALMTDFINRDNPVERSAIEQDRVKALTELDRVRQEIEQQTKAIADIEDEARRAGVPPGWLRS